MSDIKLKAASGGGSISLKGPSSAGSDTDFLDTSGNLTVTGTATVGGKLRVDISTTGTVGSGSAEGIFLRNTNETDNNAVTIFGGADDYSAAASAINFVNVDHSANVGAISFDTRTAGNSYAERLRINQDGNVGIGTASPNVGSHSKALTISNTASGARTALEVIGNTANCHAAIDFKSDSTLVSAINSRGTDRLQFCTGSSGNVKAEVTGDNFKIEDGNLIIGTAGHGIDFSATADAGGGSSNRSELLDDYEEGQWAPSYTDGSSYVDFAAHWYVKVGSMVTVFGNIRTVSSGTTGTAAFYLTGLPYASANVSNLHFSGTIIGDNGWSEDLGNSNLVCQVYSNQTVLRFWKNSGNSVGNITLNNIGDSANLMYSISYLAA